MTKKFSVKLLFKFKINFIKNIYKMYYFISLDLNILNFTSKAKKFEFLTI